MRSQTFKNFAVAASLMPLGAYAFPAVPSLGLQRLVPRGGYQGIAELYVAVKEYLKDRNAYVGYSLGLEY